MTRTVTLIINPHSGTLSKKGLERWLPAKLRRMQFDVHVALTERPGHATELAAAAAASGHYAVLACGGDGTVNEVATGLIGTPTILGILPAGSGNGLARHAGIPCDIEMSLQVIAQHHVINADYATVNGRPFFCTFGIGFDAAVSKTFARKSRRGLNSYIASAVDEFVKYAPDTYEIRTGDHVLTDRAFLVTVANASQYGNNTFVAPGASIKDGMLDVTVVHDGTLIDKAWSGVEMLAGTLGNHGVTRTFRTPALTITRHHDGPAHIDGEPVQLPRQLDIQCHPGGLRLFTSRNKLRFVPIVTPAILTLREWRVGITRLLRPRK